MSTLWGREPAVILGMITAVAAVILAAITGDVNDGLITAAFTAVLAVVTRSQVSPASSSAA